MTLFRTVTPLPDENLAGLVARAAGANIYPHARDVLSLAGLDTIRPETIVSRHHNNVAELADVLGTTPGLLSALFQPALDERQVNFFGTNLRIKHRETRLRRVSPRALADKAYVRAIWSVKPLSFDPSTRETLISTCPICDGKLGFTQTWGVEFCEHCIGHDEDGLPIPLVDLRDFPQTLVEVDDEEALDFVVALIDPNSSGRQFSLHDSLAGMSRGDLFEMALALATAIGAENGGLAINPIAQGRLKADAGPMELAMAGRAQLNWPAGFDELPKRFAAAAERRSGQYGIYKEFGALAQLRKDDHLHQAAKAAISERLDAAMSEVKPSETVLRKTTRSRPGGTYIGVRQLLREVSVTSKITSRLGAHPDMLIYRQSDDPMAPVLFNSWQALSVLRHVKNLTSESSLCAALGLPPDAVRDLEAAGFFGDLSGMSCSIATDLLSGDAYYSKIGIDHFVQSMIEGIRFQKRPAGYIALSEAMLMFPSGRRPWLSVMLPILFQEADAVFHHNVAARPKVRNLFHSISVNAHQIQQRRASILENHARTKQHIIGRVSAVMSIMILALYDHYVFMALDEAKLIDVNEEGADYRSLIDFAGEYILLNEAAVRSRNSRQMVRPWLEARGVTPDFDFDCKGGTIYQREKVEPHLILAA